MMMMMKFNIFTEWKLKNKTTDFDGVATQLLQIIYKLDILDEI